MAKENKLFKGILDILDSNAPTIATFGSILCSGLTVFFAYRASKAAARVQEKTDEQIQVVQENARNGLVAPEEAKSEEKRIKVNSGIQLAYTYRWSLMSAFGSMGLAFLSNHLNGRTIAGMSALIAMNQDKIQKGSEKLKELVGEEKFEKIRDDINRDILGERMMNGESKIEVSKKSSGDNDSADEGYERFYDTYWGQFIEIHDGVLNDALAEAERTTFLKWNDWRGMLGLESCRAGYRIGWGNKNRFKAHIGWIDTGDGGCKAIVYDVEPVGLSQGKSNKR
jgi:hypothetical protein